MSWKLFLQRWRRRLFGAKRQRSADQPLFRRVNLDVERLETRWLPTNVQFSASAFSAYKTYIGENRKDLNSERRLIDNFRGNRENTMAPRKADTYYGADVDKSYSHLPTEDKGGKRPKLPKNQRPAKLKIIEGWEPQGGMRPPC
jgi:hypothetical protein